MRNLKFRFLEISVFQKKNNVFQTYVGDFEEACAARMLPISTPKKVVVAPAGIALLKVIVLNGGGAGADSDDADEACGATPPPIQKASF